MPRHAYLLQCRRLRRVIYRMGGVTESDRQQPRPLALDSRERERESERIGNGHKRAEERGKCQAVTQYFGVCPALTLFKCRNS
jgi:hypothetical protein